MVLFESVLVEGFSTVLAFVLGEGFFEIFDSVLGKGFLEVLDFVLGRGFLEVLDSVLGKGFLEVLDSVLGKSFLLLTLFSLVSALVVETVTLGLLIFGEVVTSCFEDVTSALFETFVSSVTFSELDDWTEVLLSDMLRDLPV